MSTLIFADWIPPEELCYGTVIFNNKDVIDIVDGEHDALYDKCVHWCVLRLSFDRRRRVELGQFKPTGGDAIKTGLKQKNSKVTLVGFGTFKNVYRKIRMG